MKENKNQITNGSGWFEQKNPVTEKAPIHQKVSAKREFDKQGFTNSIIAPNKGNDKTVSLHFDIPEKDFGEFAEITLKFAKENNNIKISIMNENNRTVVKVPREIALECHDYILAKNPKFGSTDIEE